MTLRDHLSLTRSFWFRQSGIAKAIAHDFLQQITKAAKGDVTRMQRRSEWVGELHKNRLLSGHDPNAGLTYFFTSLCLSVSPCESWLANFENGMKVTGAKRQVKPGDRTCCKIKRREDEELHFESCQSGPQNRDPPFGHTRFHPP